jgi:hypothetical protein
MNPIKTYLLPLIFLLFFTVSSFAQADSNLAEIKLSETDSILVNCYFSEDDYNAKYNIEASELEIDDVRAYEDEIYEDKEVKRKERSSFWDDVPAEFVVDAVLNTLFLIALIWQ